MALTRGNQWLPSAIGATASGAFVLSQLPQRWIIAGEPTPVLVPVLVCITICLACIADALITLFQSPTSEESEVTAAANEIDGSGASAKNPTRLKHYLAALVAFALLIEKIGFIGCVVLVLPLLLYFAERLPLKRSLLTTACTGIFVYLVFVLLLGVDLPTGTLFDDYR